MRTSIILIITLVLFDSCEKEKQHTAPRKIVITKASHGADTVLIGFSDTIRIPDRYLYLSLDTIYDDSRCPVNLTCLWQGAFKIGLSLKSDGMTQQLKLGTYTGQDADTLLHGIEIKVLDLLPYPDILKPPIHTDRKVKIGLFW